MDTRARTLGKLRELTLLAEQTGVTFPRPERIEHVAVIVAASRSGSSFLHNVLSHHAGVLSLQGENVTYEKLFGLGDVRSIADSDQLNPDALSLAGKRELTELLLRDAALRDATGAVFCPERFAYDAAKRLLLQWPGIDFTPDLLLPLIRSLVTRPLSAKALWKQLLEKLRNAGHPVDAGFYDGLGIKPAAAFAGPILEEPPFVIPTARRADHEGARVLLLKSSTNCYRLDFLRSLFPTARFSFIQLARNPAASINGLLEGWLSDGFHSHDVSRATRLEIQGYASPNWWKFDLPPGWAAHVRAPLATVCAYQWISANRAILEARSRLRHDRWFDARHENLRLDEILRFLDLPDSPEARKATALPVMTVTPPAPFKWRRRQEAIAPLLGDPTVRALAFELGYDLDRPEALA